MTPSRPRSRCAASPGIRDALDRDVRRIAPRAARILRLYFVCAGALVFLLRPGEWHAPTVALLAAAVLSIEPIRARGTWWDLLPIPLIVGGYDVSASLTRAIGAVPFDPWMSMIDARWFGALASQWRSLLGRAPALTEVACLAYGSFYVLPIAVALWFHHVDKPAYDRLLSSVMLAFVGSWIGYAIVPAAGPRDADALGTGLFGLALARFLRIVERNRFDAFPSGHTAITLVVAWEAIRRAPRWAPLALLAAGAIIFSTVYLSFHYVVDVTAGIALAGVIQLGFQPLAFQRARAGTAGPAAESCSPSPARFR